MHVAYFIFALAGISEALHVLHEKRDARTAPGWTAVDRVTPQSIIPLRIALQQTNLDAGPDHLHALSDPGSPNYGKYLSLEEVHDLFAPSRESVSAVRSWLVESGINETHITHSDNKGWLAMNIPVEDVERLFQAELFEHEHHSSGNLRIGCERYHVPEHLSKHIDFITPGVKMSANLKKISPRKRSEARARSHRGPKWLPTDSSSLSTNSALSPEAAALPPALRNCAQFMTPPCWRALYGLPVNNIKDDVNSAGLYEQGDYFAQSDVSKWLNKYAKNVPAGTKPIVQGIDGGKAPVAADDPNNGGEADLDIDIITSLTYPQPVIVYQVGDGELTLLRFAVLKEVDDQVYAPQEVALDNTFNTFLDALDGSYCTYKAFGITGDSPKIDPVYPNPNPAGYQGKLQCGVYKPTRVISISYGEGEIDFPRPYIRRQCNEWMKLGMAGHTVLIASGDFGVAGGPGDPTASGCLSEGGQNQTVYNPDYPDDCPWTTSVGATRLYKGQTVKDQESVLQAPELYRPGLPNAYKYFASSGGFSNYFDRPKYQQQAVSNYLQNHDPGLPYYTINDKRTNIGANGGVYNRKGRAMPDVSANGANMPVFTNGTENNSFGTSLAAPIWAATVTLLNQRLTAAGKPPVGFINPALYRNPSVLNDIVNGSNPNCGSGGFPAAPGWDPSTGLGTPNFPKMLDYFMNIESAGYYPN